MRAAIASGLAASVLTASVLTGCAPADDELVTHRLLAMATWVDISLPPAATEREPGLIGTIETELRAFERDYYAWGDGELAALNRALSESRDFESSAELAALLLEAQSIARLTGGAFDPGVGALVELWGFHAGESGVSSESGTSSESGGRSDGVPSRKAPAGIEIERMLEASGSIQDLAIDRRVISPRRNRFAIERASGNQDSTIDPRAVGSVETRFTLDLGGIAKGAAVDRVLELMSDHGVSRAVVNAGGDLGVVGEPADRSWRIGIQAPRSDGMLGAIALHDREAAFTSGDYERFFEVDGRRSHHILDPRTGRPVDHTQAITVIATDGTLADAAATALFVAGPGRWRSMAEALGIEAVLRVDASGAIEMTAAMRDRFQPSTQVSSDIIAAAN